MQNYLHPITRACAGLTPWSAQARARQQRALLLCWGCFSFVPGVLYFCVRGALLLCQGCFTFVLGHGASYMVMRLGGGNVVWLWRTPQRAPHSFSSRECFPCRALLGRTGDDQTRPNQTKPNQTKSNQTKSLHCKNEIQDNEKDNEEEESASPLGRHRLDLWHSSVMVSLHRR